MSKNKCKKKKEMFLLLLLVKFVVISKPKHLNAGQFLRAFTMSELKCLNLKAALTHTQCFSWYSRNAGKGYILLFGGVNHIILVCYQLWT